MNIDIGLREKFVDQRIYDIPGINLRGFEGDKDYPEILKIYLGSASHDGIEPSANLEDIINQYTHLHNCQPETDMLFVEVGGEAVAYCRIWWEVDGSGNWVGFHLGNVLPEWRNRGIGTTLLSFCENRLKEIATTLKHNGQLSREASCISDIFVKDSEVEKARLLERHGYQAVRYAYDMVRPDLENIPNLPLPNGVEVRPVAMDHLRQIWEASNEAFRDHWGYIPDPWEAFEQMINDADFDPSLWRVAWEGDQVAGMVLNFINKDENERYDRKRGYTENICVRRPWRRLGLAKALIARSLNAIKERGMSEAALGVDTENTSGALNLYHSMGYQEIKHSSVYRKTIDVS
jgi:mycothiol synthase